VLSDLQTMPLSVRELPANTHGQRRTFRIGVNQTFTRVLRSPTIFLKNTMVKIVYYATECTICNIGSESKQK